MVWDGDWKHLALLYYVCMNDGIWFYIWGLVREVWEGEMLFTAIALAFCDMEICRPPRKCFFATFFCVFYPLLCSFMVFLSCFFFCPTLSSPIMLTLSEIALSYPLKIMKLSIQCVGHVNTLPALFSLTCVVSHNKGHRTAMSARSP